jgi:hypothetical protein
VRRITHQILDLARLDLRADLVDHLMRRVQQQLRCGQPLLPVDDRPLGQMTDAAGWPCNITAPRKCGPTGLPWASIRSASRRMSSHSGIHCLSRDQTYGRWNNGTSSRCGWKNASWGVLTRVSIRAASDQ